MSSTILIGVNTSPFSFLSFSLGARLLLISSKIYFD